MSQGEWAQQMKVPAPARTAQNRLSSYNNKSILNHHKMCPGSAPGYNNEGTKYILSTAHLINGMVKLIGRQIHMFASLRMLLSCQLVGSQ